MQRVWYKSDAPKQAVDLSINSDLLRQAKELKSICLRCWNGICRLN